MVQKTDSDLEVTVGCVKGNKVTITDSEPLDYRGVNDALHFYEGSHKLLSPDFF